MSYKETVQEIYAAFGRGDVPAILERLSPDVEWEYDASPTEVPWLQPRKGRAGAAEFFASLANLEFQHFEPRMFLAEGSTVVVLVDVDATVLKTGLRAREIDEVHIWHFGDDGLVTRFRHRADTLKHLRAWQGEEPPRR
jgi:ketosteroid isomerase-like protein